MSTVNSSTSSTTKSLLTAKTGVGGLVSGMDIDELVENLTATSRNKILKQQQSIQKYQWKQDSYRTSSSALKEFQSKYLDVLSSTNLRSTSFFNMIKTSASSDAVSVSSTAKSSIGVITVNSISQLATNQTVKSALPVTTALEGSMAAAVSGTMSDTDIEALMTSLSGKSILMNLDGQAKTITFDSTFVDKVNSDKTVANLEASLQELVDQAFGVKAPSDRVVTVSITDDKLTFGASGSVLTLNSIGADSSALNSLGFESGDSNKLKVSSTLANLSLSSTLDSVDNFKVKINSVEFTFNKDESLTSIMNKINSSTAGVTLSYSSITDKFTMASKTSGMGENIVISETSGNLMSALGLSDASSPNVEYGVNAILSVNNQTIIRNSNSIDIDGVKVDLVKTTGTSFTINSVGDSSDVFDTIKAFVNDYNTMIESFNKSLKEAVYKDYQPLSDEQKDEMTESQIKTWEEKAKSGLLRSDPIMRSISSKLQSAFSGMSINGVSLYSMGITSAGYAENGKLKIDEDKLKSALESNPSEITEFFTSEEGLGNTINGIIYNAIKTSGAKGSRGTLTEAAGIASTASETENFLSYQVKKSNETIKVLELRLKNEESRLWKSFTAMEQALQQLNNQSSYLSQFSSGY